MLIIAHECYYYLIYIISKYVMVSNPFDVQINKYINKNSSVSYIILMKVRLNVFIYYLYILIYMVYFGVFFFLRCPGNNFFSKNII